MFLLLQGFFHPFGMQCVWSLDPKFVKDLGHAAPSLAGCFSRGVSSYYLELPGEWIARWVVKSSWKEGEGTWKYNARLSRYEWWYVFLLFLIVLLLLLLLLLGAWWSVHFEALLWFIVICRKNYVRNESRLTATEGRGWLTSLKAWVKVSGAETTMACAEKSKLMGSHVLLKNNCWKTFVEKIHSQENPFPRKHSWPPSVRAPYVHGFGACGVQRSRRST